MIKRILLLLLCLGWILIYAQAPDPDITGSQIPQSKEQEMLLQLEAELAKGISNPDLYYNIGVLHNQQGSPGLAALYYLKALSLNSAHPQARHNFNLLIQQINSENSQDEQLFLARVQKDIFAWLNDARLAIFIVIFLFFTLLCTHWLIHYPAKSEKGMPVLLISISAIFLATFAGILALKIHARIHDTRAAITIPTANAYVGESMQGNVQSLPEATIFTIVNQKRDTYHIRLADGTLLWINAADCTRISDL